MWRRMLRILGLVHDVDEVDVDLVDLEVDVQVDEVDDTQASAPVIASRPRRRRRVIVRADDERATVLFLPALPVTREDGAPTVTRR